MDAKSLLQIDSEKWQAAYTADHAYYTKAISRAASVMSILSLGVILAYSILFMFSKLPPTKYGFHLDDGFLSTLNEGQLTDGIRESFRYHGIALSVNATVVVVKPNNEWVINDGNTQYFIYGEEQKMNVYAKRLWFTLPQEDVTALDRGALNDVLREEFKKQGVIFTENANLKVEQSGIAWVINDAGAQFFIRKEPPNINVYVKQLWFVLAPKVVYMMDNGQLLDPIRAAFKLQGKFLSDKASIKIETPGSAWVIEDGNAQYFIRNEQQNPNVYVEQHQFSLDFGSIAALDSSQVSDGIRGAFQGQNIPLSINAAIQVIQAGQKWLVNDGNTQYRIQNENQNIKVYIKQYWFSLPPASIAILDTGQMDNPIYESFKSKGIELGVNATVQAKQPGFAWTIYDTNTEYHVRNENYEIKVDGKQNGLIVLAGIFFMSALVYVVFTHIKKIALRHAERFFVGFYAPPEYVDAATVIKYRRNKKVKLPMPFSELFPAISQFKYILVKDGEILKKDDWPAWMSRAVGGPILLIVFDGSALYIERGNHFSRVVGPGVSFLERYETIKYAVDLRTKIKSDDITVWTKDGISIKLKVRINYRIGDPHKTSPKLVYPYVSTDVKKAIERYSLRWPDPTKEPGEFTWEDAAWGQVTGIVPDYIGSRFLDDILVADRKGGQILSSDATNEIFKNLNKATNAFGVYVTDFQILSIEVPQEVERYYVEYWEAEKQSRATIMDGKAKAFDIRAHENTRANAQRDLILAIADGLQKNDKGHLKEALLLSLSEVLDHSLSDSYTRTYTARETLETLDKIKSMLS